MASFEFEIQNCVTIKVDADSKDEARMKLINSDDLYYEELLSDPYISEGKLLEDD